MDSNFSIRSFFLRDKNPKNRKESPLKPETAIAVVTADGPGTTEMICPAARVRETSWLPGSLMTGIPASETRATFPELRLSNIVGILVFQL